MKDAFDSDVIDEIDREKPAAPAARPDAPPSMKLMNPFDAYLEREGVDAVFFEGKYYNFNGQSGAWTCNKTPVDLAAPLTCHVSGGIALGWIKMVDNRIVDRSHLGYLIDGYQPPPLEELPDRDDRHWPFNRQGRKEDPWRKTIYLPMRTADGESIVFGPFADTQIRAVNNFIRICRRTDRDGKDPVVLLGSESFRNVYDGITYKPTFKIVGWEFWTPGVPAPPPKPVWVPVAPPPPAKLAAPAERGNLDDENSF
jgi:hypothetical protein